VASWRARLAGLALLGALLATPHNKAAAEVLVAASLTLLTPEMLQLAILALSGGWPLPDIVCLRGVCVEHSGARGRRYCAFAGFRVLDCRHGCYDLSEKEFFNLSTTFFHVGFIGIDVDYLVIAWNQHYYIIVKACGREPHELGKMLEEHLGRIAEALSLVGCSWERVEGRVLKNVLRPPYIVVSTAGASRLAATGVILAPLLLRMPSLLPLSLAGLAAILFSRGRRSYTTVRGFQAYALTSVDSFYSLTPLFDVLARARIVYSSCARDAYLAVRMRPAAPEEEQAVDTEAYRSYEVGTALEKLSLIHRSSKFFAAARRRWERREALYLVSGLLLAKPGQQRVLEKVGLRFARLPGALEVLA